MGRSPYQSEKRRKELARLKKQEEKRQRRFNKKHEGETAESPAEAGAQPAAGTDSAGPSAAAGVPGAAEQPSLHTEEQEPSGQGPETEGRGTGQPS